MPSKAETGSKVLDATRESDKKHLQICLMTLTPSEDCQSKASLYGKLWPYILTITKVEDNQVLPLDKLTPEHIIEDHITWHLHFIDAQILMRKSYK